jgi:hypothetical protein
MQRQELEHQVLIYRYFVDCAPVPVNLVLPIWRVEDLRRARIRKKTGAGRCDAFA